MHNILLLYFVDTFLTWHAFFIAKFNTNHSFKEKMIGRKWGSKRGRFPILGGRWMFRREMGSKRGSLPPEEGDLTCMRQGGGTGEVRGREGGEAYPPVHPLILEVKAGAITLQGERAFISHVHSLWLSLSVHIKSWVIHVTSPFNWYHAVTLTFDLLQGQSLLPGGELQFFKFACLIYMIFSIDDSCLNFVVLDNSIPTNACVACET